MQAVDRELSSSEVITKGFSLFRGHFLRIALPLFFGAMITAIIRLLFTYRLSPLTDQLARFNVTGINSTDYSRFLPVAQQFFSLTVLEDLVLWIVAAPFFALGVKVAYDAVTSRGSPLSEAVSSWVRRIPDLLISSTIVGIIIFALLISSSVGAITVSIALLLLGIPAILFMLIFVMFLPAVILERESPLASLGRSRKLVSRRWRKVFFVGVIGLIMNFLIVTIFGAIFVFLNDYEAAVVQPFFTLISDVLGVSLLVILYQSLLIKEKGAQEAGLAGTGTST